MINYLKMSLLLSASFCIDTMAQSFPVMPEPVSNNAVVTVKTDHNDYIISFSGLGKNKTYKDVHNKTFVYNKNTNKWSQKSDVPIQNPINGLTGRLASVAVSIKDKAYVFGGYTVAKDHTEVSVPDVYEYSVIKDSFTRLAPMPVPVDDAVALTYKDRYIYLISGWHNDGNVNLVQIYDTQLNTWQQGTPFPGKPVFGQAGGIVNNKMLICDGVKVQFHIDKRRTFKAEPACYLGTVSKENPRRIDWRIVEHPTGKARYRMASTGIKPSNAIVFIGGSLNPYNYNGIGYNNVPSEASQTKWQYDLDNSTWKVTPTKTATMDHRGLLIFNEKLLTIGGMGASQKVLNTVTNY